MHDLNGAGLRPLVPLLVERSGKAAGRERCTSRPRSEPTDASVPPHDSDRGATAANVQSGSMIGVGVDSLLVAFAVVFLAEFGDKTEVLTLALAARYGPRPVLAGVAVTTALMNVVSVTVGVGLAHAIPARAVTVLAGLAFLGFAVWSGRSGPRRLAVGGHLSSLAVVARSAALFTVSEVGDKTMLATIALAAHRDPVSVWAGSTAGIVAAAAVAVLVGARLGNRLSRRKVRTGSAVVFAGMGLALLARAALR